eukprot:5212121-Lingulodinium_polyedra.AAC.1
MKGCSRGFARAERRWRLALSAMPGFMRSNTSSRGCGVPVQASRTCRARARVTLHSYASKPMISSSLALLHRKHCH